MMHDLYLISSTWLISSCLFSSIMLWVYKKNSRPKKILAICFSMLTVLSITLLVEMYTDSGIKAEKMDFVYSLFCIALIYFYFIYFRCLMQPQKRNKPIIIQLLITIAFYIILYAVLYSIKPEKVFLYSVEDIVDSANHPLKWLRLIVFLHFIVLLVWSSILVVKMYRKHKEEIASQFSYREKISLSWLPYLLALIILNGVGTIFDSLLSGFDSYLFIISNFLYCTFYLVYAFLGVSQQDIVYNEPETTDAPENNSEEKLSSIPANIRKQLVKELKALMEEQKIYLNSELRLDFVVKELRTNRTYVSMVLKEDFGENFIGFVNRYRIEEAKQLMSKADNLSSLYEIAEEVGFKSISSFNVFFKRFTDETPAEFRKKRFREFNLIVEESIG